MTFYYVIGGFFLGVSVLFIIVMMMAYKLACENAEHIEEQIKKGSKEK